MSGYSIEYPDISERPQFLEQKNSQTSYLAILLGFPPRRFLIIMNDRKEFFSHNFGWYAKEMIRDAGTGSPVKFVGRSLLDY